MIDKMYSRFFFLHVGAQTWMEMRNCSATSVKATCVVGVMMNSTVLPTATKPDAAFTSAKQACQERQ